jgi:hypothetical protein
MGPTMKPSRHGADDETLAGDPLGRLHQAVRRQAGQVVVDLEEAGKRAGRRGGAQADMEFLSRGAEIGQYRIEVDIALVAADERCVDEEVIDPGRSVGRPGKQKPAAGERGEDRLGDACAGHGGQNSVERAPAVGQDLGRGGGRLPMSTGNRSLGGHGLPRRFLSQGRKSCHERAGR